MGKAGESGRLGRFGMAGTPGYLPHVDGLRAVAVIAVIAYHLGGPVLPGGFVGVDVFFVISGYLITRLVLAEIAATGRFDFAAFYLRRARRLFPALFAMVAVTLVAGAFLLPPSFYSELGYQALAAIFSVSNVLFWKEAGYFDGAAGLKVLLHTWSLGVEEHFYLVWPGLLLLLARVKSLRRFQVLLVAIAVLDLAWTFATDVLELRSDRARFYLVQFRMFEFMIGAAALWIVPLHRLGPALANAGAAAGLLLVLLPMALFHPDLAVPPYLFVLPPCLGAALLIVSGEAGLTRRLLANRAAVAVGLVSYSLYLVHWPLIVFYRMLFLREPDLFAGAVLAALTLLLGWASYVFVETPFRRGRPSAGRRRFALGCLAGAVGLGACGLAVGMTEGLAWRMPGALTHAVIEAGKEQRFARVRRGCGMDDPAGPACHPERPLQVLVIGNSHETDGFNSFDHAYGRSPEVNLVSFGSTNDCDPRIDGARFWSEVRSGDCRGRFGRLASPAFIEQLDVIVWSNSRALGSAPMRQVIERMIDVNPGIRLVVMGGYLGTWIDCAALFSLAGSWDACRLPANVEFDSFAERDQLLAERSRLRPSSVFRPDFLYIDEMALLCPDGTLPSCLVEIGGEPAFWDKNHRSMVLSEHIARLMVARYGQELRAAGFPEPVFDEELPLRTVDRR